MRHNDTKIRTSIKALILVIVVLAFTFINSTDKKVISNESTEFPTQQFNTASLTSSGASLSTTPYKLGSSIAGGVFSLSGDKIYSWRDEKRWPVASLTKLMTALVAEDTLFPNKRIIIKNEHVELVKEASGTIFPGEEYTVSDLKKALLMVSSNVAAEALANEVGRAVFIEKMNEYAANIEMENTYFADPSGLSILNQSTASDLAKLTAFIFANKPGILGITRQTTSDIYDWRIGESKVLTNINKFSGRPNFIGGKTGTIPEAVGNLISIFRVEEQSGRIIIVLGSEERFMETEDILKNQSKK